MNVKRTVGAYANAGMACIMIADQVSPTVLQDIGFSIATYPLTGLMAAIAAINDTLDALKAGRIPEPPMGLEALQHLLGFEEYFEAEMRYL